MTRAIRGRPESSIGALMDFGCGLPAALGLPFILCAACATSPQRDDGGSTERPAVSEAGGEAAAQQAVDFVIEGCAERAEQHCRGLAPLVVTLTAVTVGVTEEGEWDFGDGSPAGKGWTVTHVYAAPGAYDVTLTVSGEGGTLSEQKQELVRVEAAGPAMPCLDDAGCEAGRCVCQRDCAYPLGSELCVGGECRPLGFCLSECEKLSCPVGTSCVDLGLGGEGADDPWRTNLCLPVCADDADCRRSGFGCRLAPAGAAGWRRVCMPTYPRFIGEACRDESGAVDASRCLGGLCLDIGASGYCSVPCAAGKCPEGTSCARFVGAGDLGLPSPVCLAQCGSPGACETDPLLGCQPAQSSGLFGLEIVGPADPPDTQYCTVKRCSSPADCGLSGFCDGSAGGFCLPQPTAATASRTKK